MSGKNEKHRKKNAEKTGGSKGLCLYGGTFDPVHNGHLILANFVREELDVDKIVFVPSFLPPHKDSEKHSSFKHRYTMLKLALRNNPDFIISDIEYHLQGTSYSYITIDEIKKIYHSESIYFLIGGDSLVNFHKWRKPERIVDNARVVVMGRRDYNFDTVDSKILNKVTILNTPLIEISSTEIRHRIAKGLSVRYLLPDAVINYISDNQLYI